MTKLAASAGIVKAHRGVIGVRSRVGEGTIFRLELPVGDGLSTSSAAEMIGGRVEWDGTEIAGCVLVVDDEMPVRKVVVRALARIGLHLVESPGGEEALRLLDGGAVRPDVVLMDLTMPGMGATDLLVQLRQRIPAVPVVVMSGFCEEDVLKRLDGRMTEGFLSKPFVPSVLQEKVVQVLTAARRAHAG